MHRVVEWPGIITGMFIIKSKIYLTVYFYINLFGIPFNRIYMEILRAIRHCCNSSFLGSDYMVIFLAMDRAMNFPLVKAYMFHNVYFTIIRPFRSEEHTSE